MSNEDALPRLYDDPAVVNAMGLLKQYGITGEKYEKLLAFQSANTVRYPRICNCRGGELSDDCTVHDEVGPDLSGPNNWFGYEPWT